MEPARVLAQKYCDLVGATYGLVEPYMIAAYLAGVVEHGTLPMRDKRDPIRTASGWVLTTKTIAQMVRNYQDNLERFVHDALRTRDQLDFRRAHRALLRTSARPAYVEGMREAGGDEDDLEEDDVTTINGWVDEQVGFTGEFAKAVYEASGVGVDEKAVEAVLARVPVWADSLRTLGDLGRASILKNKPGVWRYGETEHCRVCEWLDGQRHRVKWFTGKGYIPRENGSKTLECKGFNCMCGIYDPSTGERLV